MADTAHSRTTRELSPYRVLTRDQLAEDDGHYPATPFRASEFAVQLRQSWRVLLKYRWMIFGVTVTAIVGAALFTLTLKPQYTGKTTIQIEPIAPKVAPVQEVQASDSSATSSWDRDDYYQTQYQILSSRAVAERVIDALNLANDRRFVGSGKPGFLATVTNKIRALLPAGWQESAAADTELTASLVDEYLGRLTISPGWKNWLVDVSFRSANPVLSAEVANRHVREYIDAAVDRRLATTVHAREFLENEMTKAKERVAVAEAGLNEYRRQHQIVGLDGDQGDIVSDRLTDLNRRFTEAQATRIDLESKYQLVKKRDYEGLPEVMNHQLIVKLKEELSRTASERAELGRKYKASYPKMAQTIAREAELRTRLASEVSRVVQSTEAQYLSAVSREKELERQLEAQRQEALAQKDVGSDYGTLKRDVEMARQLYGHLLERLKDVGVAEQIKVSNISVIDAANPPTEASSPKWSFNLGIAGGVSLVLSLILAFLLHHLDDTLKSPEEVEARLGLPSLGAVPSFSLDRLSYGHAVPVNGDGNGGDNGKPPTKDMIVSSRPQSVIAEAYRAIQTALLLSRADRPPQVIVFTSSLVAEGKTVTAVNQAIAFSQSGGRVLLVDADIRKPRISELFQMQSTHGLSSVLTGQMAVDDVLCEVSTGQKNGNRSMGALVILPSGPKPPNPAELLGSRTMRELLSTLRERFDHIIVDCPPILPVTDAERLATMSDGVVVVVRAQRTPTALVARTLDRLNLVRAPVLGVVLNDADPADGGDYYSYSYRGYGYSNAPRGA